MKNAFCAALTALFFGFTAFASAQTVSPQSIADLNRQVSDLRAQVKATVDSRFADAYPALLADLRNRVDVLAAAARDANDKRWSQLDRDDKAAIEDARLRLQLDLAEKMRSGYSSQLADLSVRVDNLSAAAQSINNKQFQDQLQEQKNQLAVAEQRFETDLSAKVAAAATDVSGKAGLLVTETVKAALDKLVTQNKDLVDQQIARLKDENTKAVADQLAAAIDAQKKFFEASSASLSSRLSALEKSLPSTEASLAGANNAAADLANRVSALERNAPTTQASITSATAANTELASRVAAVEVASKAPPAISATEISLKKQVDDQAVVIAALQNQIKALQVAQTQPSQAPIQAADVQKMLDERLNKALASFREENTAALANKEDALVMLINSDDAKTNGKLEALQRRVDIASGQTVAISGNTPVSPPVSDRGSFEVFLTFRSQDEADKTSASLQDHGIKHQNISDREGQVEVYIGNFTSRADATKVRQEIQTRTGIQFLITDGAGKTF